MVKKIIPTLIIMLSLFTLSVNAETNELWSIQFDEYNEIYLLNTVTNEKILKTYEYDDFNNIVEKDLTEHYYDLNNSIQQQNTTMIAR